jgi:putative serine protease PepD
VLGIVALSLVVALLGGIAGAVITVRADTEDAANSGSLLPGDESAGSGPATTAERVAQRALPSVVQIQVRAGQQAGSGSGMVLSSDGLILTNNHVVEMAAGGAGQLVVQFQDGHSADADIIGRDPHSDVALVHARHVIGLTPIPLGHSDSLRIGQDVMAIGSPLGLGGTVTTGIVSALHRAVSISGDQDGQEAPALPGAPGPGSATAAPASLGEVLDAVQTDASINPGNSGGPLVDRDGRVIGMNTAIASLGGGDGQSGSVGIGFSIPIDQVTRIVREIQHDGHATTTVIKATVVSQAPTDAQNTPLGAKMVLVAPGGPAALAGLKTNDVVVKMDDRLITTSDELVAAVRSHAPGDTVMFTLSDGRSVAVVLAGEPVAASK